MEVTVWSVVWTAVVSALASAVVYVAYQVSLFAYSTLAYHLTVTLTVTSDEYLTWRYLQTYIMRHLEARARDWVVGQRATKLVPGNVPIPITFEFEGKRVRLRITERPPPQTTISQGPTSVRMAATLWARNVDAKFFERFLLTAKKEHLTLTLDTVEFCLPEVQTLNGYANWYPYKRIQRRKFSSLTLDPALEAEIFHDLHHFIKPETLAFYKEHDIPYRRGWLLHGPPGNGKSSLIVATASLLGSTVHRLSFHGLDDTLLAKLMTGADETDPPTIILLEDVDCLFSDRVALPSPSPPPFPGAPPARESTNVTFSGLLNALDGVGSPENTLIIMTTNHPERLDKALLRPGRVDKVFELTPPNEDRIAAHYLKFFPKASRFDEATLAFVSACRAKHGASCSMAAVQGAILEELAKKEVKS